MPSRRSRGEAERSGVVSLRRVAVCLACLGALACGDGTGLDPDALVSIEIVPSSPVVPPGGTVFMSLAAHTEDGSTVPVTVTWSSSDPSVATVDEYGKVEGIIRGSVTIRASVQELIAEVVLTVGFACDERPRWLVMEPAVLDPSSDDDATLTAVFRTCVPLVQLVNPSGVSDFDVVDDTTATLRLPVQQLLTNHQPGDHHVFAGYVDFSDVQDRFLRGNGFFNVRLTSMPDVSVIPLADDAQRTDHVVNLRASRPFFQGWYAEPVDARRFYELMGDDYDFVARVNAATVFGNRTFERVRNGVKGIGVSVFDGGEWYGSPATLQGIINFPSASFFDLGAPGLLHELGHRWINFIGVPALEQGAPHWPVSDLADGIMSFNIPGSGGVGGSLLGPLVPAGGTDLRIDCSLERDHTYRDLELYLMGLLPPEEVEPHVVFDRQNQSFSCGSVWSGPTALVTIDDVIDAHGPRVPGYGESQTAFSIATVVVSFGRLLSADEMAYFDHMAARGAATEPLFYSSGFVSGTTNPFYLATGGRATLDPTLK